MSKLNLHKQGNVLYPETLASYVTINNIPLDEYLNESKETFDVTLTVGNGGNFNDIKSALDSIQDSSINKRYLVYIKNGVYDITGINYLGLKDYVTIKGESKDGVIIRNSSPTMNSNVVCFDPAYYGVSIHYAKICNLTLKIKNGKCDVHIDSPTAVAEGGMIIIDTVSLIHERDTDNSFYCGGVNCGLHSGQTVWVNNCNGNSFVYAHTTVNPSTPQKPNTLKVTNCNLSWIGAFDISAKNKNYFIAEDNICDYIGIGVSNLATQKTTQSFEFMFKNNQIKMVLIIDNNTDWYSKFPIKESIFLSVINIGNEKITKGSYVSKENNSGSYSSFDYHRLGAIPLDPNKQFYGYALDDIEIGDCGTIQIKGIIPVPSNNYTVGDFVKFASDKSIVLGDAETSFGRVHDIIGNTTWVEIL